MVYTNEDILAKRKENEELRRKIQEAKDAREEVQAAATNEFVAKQLDKDNASLRIELGHEERSLDASLKVAGVDTTLPSTPPASDAPPSTPPSTPPAPPASDTPSANQSPVVSNGAGSTTPKEK